MMGRTPNPARTTDPIRLERVRNWRDHDAWVWFVRRYEPQLRAICRRHGLDGDRADEACQRAWIKLARKVRRFHYDPDLRFRGWLHRFFQRSVLDSLKAGEATLAREDRAIEWLPEAVPAPAETLDTACRTLLRRAEEVQAAVQVRVKPENWEAFRMIAIDGRTVAEAAELLGRPYMTVYRAYQRAKAMIDEERRRRAPETP